MKAKIKLWGAISEILPAFEGKGEVQVDFPGGRVKDLIVHLFSDIDPGKKGMILVEREENLPDITNKNTYENYPILLHRGMESDPEVVKQVSSAKDQLR